jgi:hypothetical protein
MSGERYTINPRRSISTGVSDTPRHAAVSSRAATNHVFDPEH